MPAGFTATADLSTAGTPLVPVTAAPDDFVLVDQVLDTYPDPDYDDFGRPIP
jgi:hypothetical protein